MNDSQLFEFMGNHPILTFFLAMIIFGSISKVLSAPFRKAKVVNQICDCKKKKV